MRRSPIFLVLVLACAPQGEELVLDGPPADLKASSRELYAQYESAIRESRREVLASFYHFRGALRVFNGAAERVSRAGLDSAYQSSWVAPTFFAWEDLTFDSLQVGTVLVTGGFKWLSKGATDTSRFLYVAVLQAADSGMAITFEHETLRPPR